MPYAPYRDIVNCFPSLARQAAYNMADKNSERWYERLLEKMIDVSNQDEELADAAVFLANFINKCREPELDSIGKLLETADYDNLTPGATTAMLARLGQVTLAMYYAASRDALRIDEKPLHLDALLKTVEEVSAKLGKT